MVDIHVHKDGEQCFPWLCGMLVYSRGYGHSGYHGYKSWGQFNSSVWRKKIRVIVKIDRRSPYCQNRIKSKLYSDPHLVLNSPLFCFLLSKQAAKPSFPFQPCQTNLKSLLINQRANKKWKNCSWWQKTKISPSLRPEPHWWCHTRLCSLRPAAGLDASLFRLDVHKPKIATPAVLAELSTHARVCSMELLE